MKRNKKLFLFVASSSLLVGASAMTLSGVHVNAFLTRANNLTLTLDSTNKPTLVDGSGTLHLGSATFTYEGADDYDNGHVSLLANGILNKDQAKGLISITANFDGDLTLYSGFDGEEYCFEYNLTDGVSENIRGNYFYLQSAEGADIESIEFTYSCETASPESHNYASAYSYDDYGHWHNCEDAHCSHEGEHTDHTWTATTLDTDITKLTDSVTFTCSTCGHQIVEEYSRGSGAGKVALGSERGSGVWGANLGGSGGIQSYAVAAWRTGYTCIDGDMAVVFGMRTPQNPGSDGTQTGAAFRIMSGYTQSSTGSAHTYTYKFKNMGSNTLNFKVYGRNGGTDTSNPAYYPVSLTPGQSTTVRVLYATSNTNLLSYFKFEDTSYENGSLAVSLRYDPNPAPVTITLTNGLFTNGTNQKEYNSGSIIPASDLDLDTTRTFAGFSDNLGNFEYYTLYTAPDRDAQVTLIYDDTVKVGSGKMNLYQMNDASTDGTSIDIYGVHVTRNALPHLMYLDGELATVYKFDASAGGTDNTHTGASFRFRTAYNSGSGINTNFYYKFKNLGTNTLTFDLYKRDSGSDTSAVDAYRVTIEPNEVKEVRMYIEKHWSSNTLTYFRFTQDTVWLNQKLAVIGYYESYPSSYMRCNLESPMTFADGQSVGYFEAGTTQQVLNIPDANDPNLVHFGWLLRESGSMLYSTDFVVGGASPRTYVPTYDVEEYYLPINAASEAPCDPLTTTYQKICLQQGYKFHPSNGYGGTFAANNRPTLGYGLVDNPDGDLEIGSRYRYTDSVEAGSHYLIMNTVKNTGSNPVDTRMLIKNNGSETIVMNIWTTGSSSTPKDLLLAENVTILPGETEEVEVLHHLKGANGNSVYCIEFVNALSSLDYTMVKYMRYSS